MEFTRNNILQQASQAMLAQANSQPQSVNSDLFHGFSFAL